MIHYNFSIPDFDYFTLCCKVDQHSLSDIFLLEHSERIKKSFYDFVEAHPKLDELIHQTSNVEASLFFYVVCFTYKTLLGKGIYKMMLRSDKDSAITYLAIISLLEKIAENPYITDFIEQLDKTISIVLESVSEQLPQ